MRNSDGYIGLYDIVNNVFYGNSGSGVFYCNYTWLDYIESTGTQWLDTGVAINSTLVSQLKFNMTAITGGVIYGNIDSSDATDYRLFNASGLCYLDFPNSSRINGGSMPVWVDHEVEVGNYYVRDLKTGQNILTGSTVSFSAQTSTLKMWRDSLGNACSSGKLYYLKIYDNNTLIRDMVPCLNNGVAGMLDKATGVFYGNSGTGT